MHPYDIEEKWQILAIIPRLKSDERHWQGLNLTWYGFLIASAYAFALALLLVLLHTAGMNLAGVSLIMLALLASCLPAARIVARIVEKKSGTFTVAGASFTGLILLPGLVYVVNLTGNFRLKFKRMTGQTLRGRRPPQAPFRILDNQLTQGEIFAHEPACH